jgi:hypothetical protein
MAPGWQAWSSVDECPDTSDNPEVLMGVELPSPVDRFVAAINAFDTDGFISFFPEDGVVDDWGRRFVGPAAIREWSDAEFIGREGHLEPKEVTREGDTVTVKAHYKNTRLEGDDTFQFITDGDQIQEMRILAH